MPSKYRGPTDDEAKEAIRSWLLDFIERTPGMSDAEAARQLGVDQATISNIRHRKFMPGFTALVRIHFAFGAALNEVLRHSTKAAKAQTKAPDHIAAQARK